ncbi:MAG: S8 family serine peptidase, partial [Bdellovibrionota bacterium]
PVRCTPKKKGGLATKNLDTKAYLDQFDGPFDIFNYSWGDPQCQLTSETLGLTDKLAAGSTSLRAGKGAIFVKAAGNEFTSYLEDCDSSASPNAIVFGNVNFSEEYSTPYMITVAALNAKGQSSSYSSPGSAIWISAPGGEFGYDTAASSTSVLTDPALLTTDYPGCDVGFKSYDANAFDRGGGLNSDCYHTARMNGTSGAAPIVSGAVALLLQVNPSLGWRDIKHILASTADKVQPTAGATQHPSSTLNLTGHVYQQGWVTNAAGFPFHNWFGFGRVNVDRAVAMARGYVSSLGTFKQTNPSTGSFKYDAGTLSLAVPDASATGAASTLAVTENYIIENVQAAVSVQNCAGQVGVELTSPSNTKSILLNINSQLGSTSLAEHYLATNAFYGERSAGTWTLKVVDGRAGCQATFSGWKLNVMGH